jgi:GGDEF domain-containing protein
MKSAEDGLQEAANVELGRILNKDLFLYILDLEVKRARRYQNFLCLLLLNLREFPKNDDRKYFQTCHQTLSNLLMEEMRETDILGSLDGHKLVVLLPYADKSAGNTAKARFEGTLKYYDFKGKGCEVNIDQVCFPINGTDTVDLIKKALGVEPQSIRVQRDKE